LPVLRILRGILLLVIFLAFSGSVYAQQQRFPKPEFESGYEQPDPETPEPRDLALNYLDVGVLLAVLSLASWFALKRRSRRGLFWLSVFSLIYFGFYKEGCICSVGSLQNVALSLSDPAYAISITALAFFLLPLVFTLLFGRTFCASACPLGVIQDLVVVKPISISYRTRRLLGLIPYLYLSLAVLYAVTRTDFIICRYDPFVGIFRMDAEFHMIVLGVSFLLMGMFIGRPYCRFLCPYGVLLNWMSRFSWKHLSITRSDCIQCRLCTNSCPFDAIEHPTGKKVPGDSRKNRVRFITYAVLLPVWILIGGYAGSKSHVFLSRVNDKVALAELIISRPELKEDPDNIDIQTFLASGESFEMLVEEAGMIRKDFRIGGWFAGGFLGLAIGFTLLSQVVFRRREDFEPHRGDCYSCGRCMDYCPVEKTNP
jgi:ferredoxin